MAPRGVYGGGEHQPVLTFLLILAVQKNQKRVKKMRLMRATYSTKLVETSKHLTKIPINLCVFAHTFEGEDQVFGDGDERLLMATIFIALMSCEVVTCEQSAAFAYSDAWYDTVKGDVVERRPWQ